MLELTTLGGISLRTADRRQTIDLLRHPKQLALLVYLAVETRPATRDELIGLFWPDATEQKAQQSLSQAASGLRRILGVRAIVRVGSMIRRIAPDVIRPDTADFDAAVAAKRWSDAVMLYHGEFLKGFVLPEAREFEDWTSCKREHYRRQAVRAAEARAKQLRTAGDLLEAARVLRHASEIAPEREDLAAAVVEAFADAGQVLPAIDWFTRYARRLKEIFEESPTPTLAARVEQLRAVARNAIVVTPLAREPAGRLVASREVDGASIRPGDAGAPWARASTPPTCSSDAPGQGIAHQKEDGGRGMSSGGSIRGPSGIRSRLRFPGRPLWSRAAVLGTMGAVSALGGAIWLGVGDTAEAEPRGRPTTLLISIANRTPDIGWRHLAQSLEETLAARMSNPPRLYTTVRQDASGAPQRAGSRTGSPPPAQRRSVDFVLAGTVHQTAERVRIELRVFDGTSNRAIRNVRVNRPRRDVFALLDETAEELADTLRPLLGSAIGSRMARSRTTSTAAWSDLERSKALLADARRFAKRGAGPQAATLLGIADSLAHHAARVDPRWVDAPLQVAQIERDRGVVQLGSTPPDLASASEHLAAAARIITEVASRWPHDVRVHELAGTVSYYRWVVASPDESAEDLLDGAVQSLERAVSLDPFAAQPWVTLSQVQAAREDHAASAIAARQALDRDAFAEHTDELHNRLFHAYFELRQDEDATRWCDEINRRGPGSALGAYCKLNLQGWSSIGDPDLAVADSLIENLHSDPPKFTAMMKPRLRMLQSAIAARLGETQTARRLLDDAVANARHIGDADAASFYAAALIRLGEVNAARNVLDDWMRSPDRRVPVQRWLHEADEADPLES